MDISFDFKLYVEVDYNRLNYTALIDPYHICCDSTVWLDVLSLIVDSNLLTMINHGSINQFCVNKRFC
jgi:hypothetical protein